MDGLKDAAEWPDLIVVRFGSNLRLRDEIALAQTETTSCPHKTLGLTLYFCRRYHIVWATKYRHKVLEGELRVRIRAIIRQVCAGLDVTIIKGVLSRDHVHMLVSFPPKRSVAQVVQRMKGRSSGGIQRAHGLLGATLLGARLLLLQGAKHRRRVLRRGLPPPRHASASPVALDLEISMRTRPVRRPSALGLHRGNGPQGRGLITALALIRANMSWECLAVRHVDAVAEANEDEARVERNSRKTSKYKKVCLTDPEASMATSEACAPWSPRAAGGFAARW